MANAGLEFHKENLFGGKGMNTRIFSDASFVEEYLSLIHIYQILVIVGMDIAQP